ncbi:hypothetical protein [Nonomuraea jabiensis]|uniref:Cytidylate kinase n=1 Tax=Nonomuraea jabiensis TaxID=882448 RepID=A0A7W9G2H6_9ACTN|nr:hypothetical protein [Nonomuraea jabiensis]MBB5775980.1 cytidylate kinase [Nonomuraea jabiensis]
MPVLIISGPVGVGKTSVAGEIFDQLIARDISHAVIDLDNLGLCWPFGEEDPYNDRMAMRNLADVWRNYAAAGVERLVIARVVETRDELAAYRAAVPGADVVVCQLMADKQTLLGRVARREAGSSQEALARRAVELADSLAKSDVADIVVSTADRELTDIALEVLRTAHWIESD